MGKKHICPEFENHERWLVSFADMMTLLFALFVVLFSLKDDSSSGDEVEQVASAAAEVFSSSLEATPVDQRVGPEHLGYGIFEHFKGDTQMPSDKPGQAGGNGKQAVLSEDFEKIKALFEERVPGERRAPLDATVGSSRVLSVERMPGGIGVRLLASHYYKGNSYRLSTTAKKDLDKLVPVLKNINKPVSIEGHTDSVPPTAGAFGNWEISALRASFMARYLIQQHNFPKHMVSATGWADAKPIASNSTLSGRQINSRVELKVQYE